VCKIQNYLQNYQAGDIDGNLHKVTQWWKTMVLRPTTPLLFQ